MTARGPNGAAVPTHPSSPAPDLFAHQPPPRPDGKLPITITHLEMAQADWTRRGQPPDIGVTLERVAAPTAAFYRELYDRVGRPWLWYELRLLSDAALQTLLDQPGHELHGARHDAARPQHQHARPSASARHLSQSGLSRRAQREQGIAGSARAVA